MKRQVQKKTNQAITVGQLMDRRGFTLVELMVTIVVFSVFLAAVYQLFNTTSEAMYEVNSLAETTDRARFAMETISRDIDAAGAFASPDLDMDPWRNQDHQSVNGNYTARGLILRDGAQDQVVGQVMQQNITRWGNPLVGSDELIIMGAIDFPFGFEVNRLLPGFPANVNTVSAPVTPRGLIRFKQRNPFDLGDLSGVAALNPSEINALLGPPGARTVMGLRAMRIRDRNGYIQMAPIANATVPDANGMTFQLDNNGDVAGHNGFSYRIGGQRPVLEPSAEADIGYEVSLVDAYRYRLCVDSEDRRNLRLVRERVDAGVLLNRVLPAGGAPPVCGVLDPAMQTGGNAARDQIPIVDNVVDFQVWVDCADGTGNLVDQSWTNNWIPPTPAAAGHECLTPNGANPTAGMARVLHIRVTVRTKNERVDLENYGFISQDPTVGTGTTTNPAAAGSGLKTFDIDNDHLTATRTKTFQMDIDLKNFSYINATNAN